MAENHINQVDEEEMNQSVQVVWETHIVNSSRLHVWEVWLMGNAVRET